MRTGYSGATKLAIYRFHKSNNAHDAQQYLNDILASFKLVSVPKTTQAQAELAGYISWVGAEAPAVAVCKLRLDLNLGDDVVLGGEISRVDVDLHTEGYRGILLGDLDAGWKNELRMPLIQRGIAERLARPESEVSVGVQALDGSGLETTRFSTKEIDTAMDSARRLAGYIAREWESQGGE